METVLYRRTFGHVPNKLRKRKTCGGGLKASLVSKVPYKCRVCVCVFWIKEHFFLALYTSPTLVPFCCAFVLLFGIHPDDDNNDLEHGDSLGLNQCQNPIIPISWVIHLLHENLFGCMRK